VNCKRLAAEIAQQRDKIRALGIIIEERRLEEERRRQGGPAEQDDAARQRRVAEVTERRAQWHIELEQQRVSDTVQREARYALAVERAQVAFHEEETRRRITKERRDEAGKQAHLRHQAERLQLTAMRDRRCIGPGARELAPRYSVFLLV
jgi:hypothetical protein